MTLTLTYSSEMMTNYLQAEIIAPQNKFEAMQAADGCSLLFAVGTNGAFNVIQETSGTSASGWQATDLSSKQIGVDFPSGGSVSTFDVGQSVTDGTFGLAMVVTSGTQTRLYLSLGNSSTDLSWIGAPVWTGFAYDDVSVPVTSLEIVGVYFCEPVGSKEYILVDVVRDPSSAVQDVHRYVIDPTRPGGHAWASHDLPIDIEVGNYDSVVGRVPNGLVDGLYTAGQAGTTGQLVYVPIVNAYGDGPPQPIRLSLPTGVIAGAIATTRNSDLSTDLFAVGGSTLYYFASTNQADGAAPVTVLTNDVLSGTTQLDAVLADGVVTLWGRNGSDEVYSMSCPAASAGNQTGWTVPVPLLSGIEHIAAYVNAVDGGNTIFAAGGGAVERFTRDTANGLWVTDQITLPAAPTQPAISFNSYTTTIQVTDGGQPAANATIGLAANRRAAVYVNGLYYVVGSTPVQVSTTSFGTITIVESTGTVTGTTFTMSNGASSVTINPMDGPFQKLAQLDSGDKLAAATITNQDGSTTPLVAKGTSQSDLAAVSSGLAQLGKSYTSLSSATPVRSLAAAAPAPAAVASVGDDILVGIGDLFRWLESGVEAVVEVVEDAGEAVWHFVATIGEDIYTAVIDSVEAVVGAAVWLFDVVKTAVEDVIKYVEFLFEWDDIGRTKAVLHNLVKQFLVGQVDELQVIKSKLDASVAQAEQQLNQWSGTDWTAIGDAASKPASGSASNPMAGQNAASQHLSHHFQNNAGNISIIGDAPAPNLLESLVQDLFTALKNEATVLDEVIDQLGQLAKDFSSLSVEDVLKRLVAILAEAVLSSAQVVIDVILDILTDVAMAAVTLLDTKIHIPVISDILNAIGIPDLSFLDLFCWIAAVAYTVVYKIAKGAAPFPDDDSTTFLSTATSMADLQQAFATPAPAPAPRVAAFAAVAPAAPAAVAVAPAAAAAGGPIPMPAGVAEAVFIAGHGFAGFFTLMSDFVSTFEAAAETGDNPWSTPSAVLGVLGGASGGVTNALVPRDPIENTIISDASTATTVIRILAKLLFSGPAQGKFAAAENVMKNLAVGDGRATGAIVDAILVIPALAWTGWHFYEIAESQDDKSRTDAILEEVSNLTSYISRVAYAAAVNDDDPETRAIIIGVMAVANLATAGLQTAEAVVG